jgi:hypothetical protein
MLPSLDSTLHERKRWSIKWSNKTWIAWIACRHHEELPLFRLPQRQILKCSVTRSKGSQQKMKSQQTTQLPKKTLNPVFWAENRKNCSYQEWRSTFKTARQAPVESKDQENRSAAVSPENKAAKKKAGLENRKNLSTTLQRIDTEIIHWRKLQIRDPEIGNPARHSSPHKRFFFRKREKKRQTQQLHRERLTS